MSPLLDLMRQETVQSVVHDLRTPITVIKGYLHVLLSGVVGQMPDEQKQLIERSVGPLEDLILLTENLLQSVILDNGGLKLHLAATDLDLLLAETIEFYQLPFKQREMDIYREGNTLGLQLMADGFWLKRVLHNLIWNAYKFTPNGGKVSLHVRHLAEGVDIIVQDTGRGIPIEKLTSIFEKFAQSAPSADRKSGAGLGLWICKRVMELHGGTIRADSSSQGSRIILFLPRTCIL